MVLQGHSTAAFCWQIITLDMLTERGDHLIELQSIRRIMNTSCFLDSFHFHYSSHLSVPWVLVRKQIKGSPLAKCGKSKSWNSAELCSVLFSFCQMLEDQFRVIYQNSATRVFFSGVWRVSVFLLDGVAVHCWNVCQTNTGCSKTTNEYLNTSSNWT